MKFGDFIQMMIQSGCTLETEINVQVAEEENSVPIDDVELKDDVAVITLGN